MTHHVCVCHACPETHYIYIFQGTTHSLIHYLLKMPLHLPHIFHRSRSRDFRTDLSATYRDTKEQRKAQGYSTRSDWHEAIYMVNSMLTAATDPTYDIDWHTWNIDSELQELRRFHFEDLDQTDQMVCPIASALLLRSIAILRPKVKSAVLAKMERAGQQLKSFREQAEQLYGHEACAAAAAKIMWLRTPGDAYLD